MQTKTNIKAEIVADSINQQGDRLTSLLITFPRIILAEVNTHRMLCLAGDMEISFDLPTTATTSTNFRHYSMPIKEFVEKWHNGAKKRKRHSYEVNLENKEYTAKEISKLVNKEVSNIRSKCRDGAILVQNPNKKRSEDFIINGLDYNEYHNGFESKGQNITNRLKSMKIRMLNEDTGLIEHSTVKDCFISGEKQIFKLTLKDGKTLRCSKNHRILTENGWKTLENLSIDDYVITQSFGLLDHEKSDVNKYQYIEGKWVSQFLREIKSEINKKQNNKCLKCGDFITDLHHVIPIHKDISKAFEKNNIIGLCEKCHSKEHNKQGWQVSKYLYGKGVEIAKIEKDGFEQTYDLEIEGKFPNFIANGIVVHNSKNTSSSRAIPFKKMVESVENDPFIPIAWQKPHKGMQGTEYYDHTLTEEVGGLDYTNLPRRWLRARDTAISMAKIMTDEKMNMPVTKQLANRLLEPFMWTTMLITGSQEGWDNFFELRCPQYEVPYTWDKETKVFRSRKDAIKYWKDKADKDKTIGQPKEISEIRWFELNKGQAEIHMMALAEAIYDVMNESTPKQLETGQWHIPFEDRLDSIKVEKDFNTMYPIQPASLNWYLEKLEIFKVKISTAMAARTSYTVVGDEKEINYQRMIELHDRLLSQDPPHCFTEGTEILTDKGWIDLKNVSKESNIAAVNTDNLRFNGFEKPDNVIKEDYVGIVYELPHGDIGISPNHILLGNIISTSSDRTKSYEDVSKIIPTEKRPNTRRMNIFREIRMFSACNPQYGEDKTSILYLTGVLYGFFIGDGHCRHKNVYFHLKKKRKIRFLEDLLLALDRSYSITKYEDGSINLIISEDTDVFTKFYDANKNKIIPNFLPNDNLTFLNGLFEGLKNSDGSVKRNTWTYDTTSKPLHDRMLELCPLIGLTGISYDTYDHFRIGFTTNNNVLINDSRRGNSKVIEKEYSGKLYCVEIPSKGIIVRKNGKVLITHNSSPMEHCARAMSDEEFYSHIRSNGEVLDKTEDGENIYSYRSFGWCRNFKGFIQYRHLVENY